jgi:hypothetical protein
VLRGWAPESLLSTYEAERRFPVVHNVHRSTDPLGSRRDVVTEMPVDLGGRIRHVWVDDLAHSTVDLVDAGLTLFVTANGVGEWGDAVRALACRLPISVVALDAMAARSLGLGLAGALLVRPDGVPVASWWTADDADGQLRHAVASLIGEGRRESVRRSSAA